MYFIRTYSPLPRFFFTFTFYKMWEKIPPFYTINLLFFGCCIFLLYFYKTRILLRIYFFIILSLIFHFFSANKLAKILMKIQVMRGEKESRLNLYPRKNFITHIKTDGNLTWIMGIAKKKKIKIESKKTGFLSKFSYFLGD